MPQTDAAAQLQSAPEECVKVVVRCRPMSQQEVDDGRQKIVFMDSDIGQVQVKNKDGGQQPFVFSFDGVYDEKSRQLDLYRECGAPIVDSIMSGYNGTIFAYGQTGSGKTFTMEGQGSPEDRGVIPNAFSSIFGAISTDSNKQFLVRVSFLEIYQEEIHDLLAKRKKCDLREDVDKGVYVKDITYIGIKNEKEIEKVMEVGKKNRRAAATAMNPSSSRSHSIFTITVETSEMGEDGENRIRVGKLNLVDLAGSERQAKTHAEGERLKEAIKINLSLSALGNVIKALVSKQSTHVPYRDSKLTRLLQDSLGGNTKTVMIATVGPADWNMDETLSTLRYATRAKSIKNKPKINEDPKDALLRQFQEEIERLKRMLEQGAGVAATSVQMDQAAIAAGVVGKGISEEELLALQQQKESEKQAILEEKGQVEGKLKMTEAELTAHQAELERARQEQEQMRQKLSALENQVLAGGVELEKARQKEIALEHAHLEQQRIEREQQVLQKQLQAREAELDEHREKFSSVQDEIQHKTRALKKAYAKLSIKQEEMDDLQAEFDQEREDMLDTIRELAKQLKYQKAILDALVPVQDLQAIEQCLEWDQELDDWVLVKAIVSPVQREMKLKDLIIDSFIPPSELQKIVRRAEWDADLNDYRIARLETSGNRIRQQGRPQSAFGLKRPVSAFAKAVAQTGTANPRFRSENIIDVPLDMPDRHTQDYEDLAGMQDVNALLQDAYQMERRAQMMDAGDVQMYRGYDDQRSSRPPSRHARPKTASRRDKPPAAASAPDAAYGMQSRTAMRPPTGRR